MLPDADLHEGSFEPTIVAGLGYAGNQVQLMSVPPYAVAFVGAYFDNKLSDVHLCRQKKCQSSRPSYQTVTSVVGTP